MKELLIGDLHWGEKNNSPKFHGQVMDFLKWVRELAESRHIERCIQLGDWYHHRNKLDVATVNASIQGAKLLGDTFGKENVWVLLGNHDLYYLNRLDVHSLKTIQSFVTVIDSPTETPDGTGIVIPWITDGEMWDRVVDMGDEYDYLFSHLELNGFQVNDQYTMEHGFSHRELRGYNRVLTGHYHSRQTKDNITYVGTPYPITMNEANEAHGVYILDTETGELEFVEYTGIRVVSIPYTEIDTIEDYDPENTSIRVEFPDDLEDETVITDVQNLLKEKNFQESKIKYTAKKVRELLEADVSEVSEVQNIDEVVLKFLDSSIEVDGVDKSLLKELYREAKAQEDE